MQSFIDISNMFCFVHPVQEIADIEDQLTHSYAYIIRAGFKVYGSGLARVQVILARPAPFKGPIYKDKIR